MVEQKENYKIIVMLILLAGACVLTYYFHAILDYGRVFTHFFYIPIILAALWWRRKGLVVAVFLAALIIFSHIFVRAGVVTANDYLRALMFIVIAFVVATLSEVIAKAQEKTAHLNTILNAIRNVNQLIAKEKDRDRLIPKACKNLIETRGCYSAWIALVDENGGFITAAEAGLGGSFFQVVEMMKRGEFTRCGQKALKQSEIVVVEDVTAADCAGCPLVSAYSGRAGMAIRLEYRDRIYGILSVSIPAEMAADADEHSLFNEVAGDLAFALHSIELEEERKQAEEALQRFSEELKSKVEERTKDLAKERDYTRHLFESSPDSQMTLDKDGKILDVNEAFEHRVDKRREDLIGASIYEYRPKEETEKAIAEIFEQGKVRNVELPLNIPGKEALLCNLSGTVFTTPEGELGVHTTNRDITEQRRAEEALKKEKNFSANVITAVPDSLLVLDANLRIKSVNRSFYEKFQTEPDEVIGSGVAEVLGDNDGKLSAALTKLFETGDMLENFELQYQSEKLGERIFNITARGMLIAEEEELVVIEDITERKRSEEVLRVSEEKYRDLGELLPEVIFETDLEGNITYANQIAFDSFGYTQSDFDRGVNALQMLIPEDRDMGKENIQRVLSGQTIGSNEYTAQRRDKTTFPVLLHSRPIIHENKPVGMRGVITDITERKRAEETLRESEERFRTIVETAPSLFMITDAEGNNIYVSPNCEEITGYTQEELRGERIWWVHEDDTPSAKELFEHTFREGVGDRNFEYKLVKKNGEVRYASSSWEPLKDEEGEFKGIVFQTIDITERKHAEDALWESEGKLNAMLQSIGDHMSMMDKDLNILWANGIAKKIFGNDIIGKKCYEVYHRRKEPCEPYPCLTLKAFQDGEVHEHDTQVLDKDGKIVYFHCTANVALRDKEGNPTAVIEISRDITKRKQAEEEAKKSRKFLDTIIKNIPDPIYIKDRQFRFVDVNKAFYRTHKDTNGEILGEMRYRETDDEVFKTGKELNIPEQHYTDAEGNQHWTHLKKVPLTDESGNITHVLTISHDVSDRKRAEEMLRESHERLEELNKMKTDFLNVAYHEMRSPLTPIVGYTSLLEQGELTEKQKKYVRIIEESASRLEKLIESLLEVTRMEAGKIELTLQTMSIPEIVDNVLERVKLQVEAKKQTISAVVPEGIEVEGDKQKITAIFDNLISNAIKYTGENGKIDVVVEDRKKEGEIRVCVADTGVGIPEEHLHRLFERFYMVDNSLTRKGGLGLGLAIVKGYVEMHGGKVWVTSEPGKGSKFWFTLPKRRN